MKRVVKNQSDVVCVQEVNAEKYYLLVHYTANNEIRNMAMIHRTSYRSGSFGAFSLTNNFTEGNAYGSAQTSSLTGFIRWAIGIVGFQVLEFDTCKEMAQFIVDNS